MDDGRGREEIVGRGGGQGRSKETTSSRVSQRPDDRNRIGFLLPCPHHRSELLAIFKNHPPPTQARVRSGPILAILDFRGGSLVIRQRSRTSWPRDQSKESNEEAAKRSPELKASCDMSHAVNGQTSRRSSTSNTGLVHTYTRAIQSGSRAVAR